MLFGNHRSTRHLATRVSGLAWTVPVIAIAIAFAAPVLPQTDAEASRAKTSFLAIQRQVDSVANRMVNSTVALQFPGVSGSGVIISPDGYVLTAAHVLAAGESGRCHVILADGRRFQASVLGADRQDDFGLIKIQEAADLTVSPLGDSSVLRAGEWILATGHPLGLHTGRPPVVRIGRVLPVPSRRRSGREPRRIMTDAPLISGDSGGPLFDLQGRVVGINSMITDGDRLLGSIHVPVNLAKAVLPELEHGDNPTAEDIAAAPFTQAMRTASAALAEDNAASAARAATEAANLDQTSAAARFALARADARVGKTQAALTALREAADCGYNDGQGLRQDPDFSRLHGQPAFQSIMARLDSVGGVPGTGKGDPTLLSAARGLESNAVRGIVGIFSGPTQVALGTVMSPDGDILTKASELPEGALTCVLPDGRKVAAERKGMDPSWDVALLKVKASGLATLSAASQPALGHWTFTPDASGDVEAVGVVGVADMPVHGAGIASKPTSTAYMGVRLEPLPAQALRELGLKTGVGVLVEPDQPAAQAGIKTGDVLYEVEGQAVTDPDGLMDLMVKKKPGDSLSVKLMRDDEKMTVTINLTKRPRDIPGRGGLPELLSGDVSHKAGPYAHVIQHDAIVAPKAMGGPVLDADGKLIGINIARADRTSTYAIPARYVSEIYSHLKAGL